MLGDIILNLTIIGKIPKGGRIKRDATGKVSLESDWSLQSLTRFARGNSREQAVSDVNKVKDEAFDKANDIMDNKFFNIYKLKENPTESEDEAHNKKVDEINELCQALTKSVEGITNLRETYKDDATIDSRLDITISEINNKVTEMKSKLDIVHYTFIKQKRRKSIDNKTKSIIKNVTFGNVQEKEIVYNETVNDEDEYNNEEEDTDEYTDNY